MTAPDYPPIEIVRYSEVIDNWGHTESSSKPERVAEMLNNAENFSDDVTFEDKDGHIHFIDDLIGHKVKVGDEVFVVPTD